MAGSFKHTNPCPVDFSESVAPPTSPLTSPERDAREMARLSLNDANKAADTISAQQEACILSPYECAVTEAALGLPRMLPEKKDLLCGLPGRPTQVIAPGGNYYGTEILHREAHKLSERVIQHPKERRVGIDAPWAPDTLTADSVLEAHVHLAEQWRENEGGNRIGVWNLEQDLRAMESDSEGDGPLPGVRLIHWKDQYKLYPVGPAAGEQFKLVGFEMRRTPRQTRPVRPCGVFDPAEVLYYARQQRIKYMRQITKAGGTWAEAVAVAEKAAGGRKTFAEMEDEAETAEMVLRVYGKLAGLPGWSPPAETKEAKKAKPPPKGKGGKKRKQSVSDEEATGEQDPRAVESGAAAASGSQGKKPATVAAQETAGEGEEAAGQNPSATEGGGAAHPYGTRSKRRKLQ